MNWMVMEQLIIIRKMQAQLIELGAYRDKPAIIQQCADWVKEERKDPAWAEKIMAELTEGL